MFDEIMQWGDISPTRQQGDFTVTEFAAHIGRSEPTAKRALMGLVEDGKLATEKRYDPNSRRPMRVWWKVTQTGGKAIAVAGVGAGDRGGQ